MDEILLSKVRLTIVARLVEAEWVTFSDLLETSETTNGNLGAHLGKLIEAGYVQEQKRFVGSKPQSRYRLAAKGRRALLQHVSTLQALVDSGR